jgi:NADH dehydrogenase (ubiquinone) Fe-S protein 5
MACYVINQNDAEARKQGVCAPRLEDYYECLHHKKEVRSPQRYVRKSCIDNENQHARAQAIQDALRKAEAAHPRENAPKAGQIRSLGLIGNEEGTKETLKAAS